MNSDIILITVLRTIRFCYLILNFCDDMIEQILYSHGIFQLDEISVFPGAFVADMNSRYQPGCILLGRQSVKMTNARMKEAGSKEAIAGDCLRGQVTWFI